MNTRDKSTLLITNVDEETQRLIADAAELLELSLNEFLIHAAKKIATETKRQATRLQVSHQSADRMLQLLDNPEPISPKLEEAALNHSKLADDFKNRRHR